MLAPEARAAGVSVHLGAGVSTMSLQAGAVFDKSGGIGMELRPQINIEWNSLNAAMDLFYQGRLGSTGLGSFPLSRTGMGLLYYPWGLPLQTSVLDNGVTLTQNHFSPFLIGQLMLTSIAVTDTTAQTTSSASSFNGLAVGFQAGGGAEMPMSQTTSIVLELLYEGTVSGGSNNSTSGALNYKAVNGILAFAIHP